MNPIGRGTVLRPITFSADNAMVQKAKRLDNLLKNNGVSADVSVFDEAGAKDPWLRVRVSTRFLSKTVDILKALPENKTFRIAPTFEKTPVLIKPIF